MVRNKEKYDQAISLRKRGFTLDEIAKYCDISKSTASKWLKNKGFSDVVTKQNKRRAGQENAKRLKLINKARRTERIKRYQEIERSAGVEYKHYKKDSLFVAGLTLYLATGDDGADGVIRFSTKKIDSHRIFIAFAQEYLGVEKEKIHFWIALTTDLDEEKCMRKWQRAISLPYSQFYKNQIIPGKTNKKRLHFGVGNTIIASTVHKRKLLYWTRLLIKELTK